MREHHFFRGIECYSQDVVVVDFPWPWETYSKAGRKKSPQYQTMTLDAIAATRADQLLAPGGVMIAWATWPLIGKQHLIIENSFGLDVKTGGAWSKRTGSGKLRWGPGHIIRTVCEPFLIATKRDHKVRGRSIPNLIETLDKLELPGLAREHSRKPEEFFELVEKLTPGRRWADIFSREQRPRWTCWGNQVEKFNKK